MNEQHRSCNQIWQITGSRGYKSKSYPCFKSTPILSLRSNYWQRSAVFKVQKPRVMALSGQIHTSPQLAHGIVIWRDRALYRAPCEPHIMPPTERVIIRNGKRPRGLIAPLKASIKCRQDLSEEPADQIPRTIGTP